MRTGMCVLYLQTDIDIHDQYICIYIYIYGNVYAIERVTC